MMAAERRVASPDGKLALTVSDAGGLNCRVEVDGQPLLKPSRLGLEFAGGVTLGPAATIRGAKPAKHDKTWENPFGNHRSRLKCLSLATGDEQWVQEGFGWSNLILFDGKLVILRQVGELVIADASPARYHEIARHQALDGRSWTVPALANGHLFLRNNAGAVACFKIANP